MAKYEKYAEYKDSGVKWFGSIPEHWSSFLFKRVVANIKDGTHGTHARVENGELLLSAKNVFNNGIEIGENESYIPFKDYEEITSNGFPKKGDILVTCVGTIGRSFVYPFDKSLAFQRSVSFMRLNKKGNPQFYKYFIESKAYQSQLESLIKSSAQGGIYMGDLINTVVIKCPLDEQIQISNFLDHETAKIDSLIAKQEKLIELLKEKRQAVISHAVTKGLNPDVPMKDSGVEWLGEVPAHWEVSRVGWLCEFISYGFTNPMPSTDEGPYMLTATDIEFGRVKYEGARRTSIEAFRNLLSPKSKPQAGDILVTKDGTLGRTALFDGDNEVCISQSVALLRLHKKIVLPEFLVRAFSGADYQSKIIFDAGGTTIKHIYISTLSKMNFVLPPMHEQKILVDELKIKLADMDRLIDQAINASNLLGERRTALISSAVTGKIDVRNWQHPNEAKTEFSA